MLADIEFEWKISFRALQCISVKVRIGWRRKTQVQKDVLQGMMTVATIHEGSEAI